MTEITTSKSTGRKLAALLMTFAYLAVGSAFLAAPVVYADLHHQKFPPLIDMVATVAVGVALTSYALVSLKNALGR
jgi:steroid 5-alpha reductase family enzyme|nr:hypothetical protein [Neorhizobium tomejilense]